MRLTGTRAYYRPSPPKMPPGLVELMEGLTKEVLKHNPSDIYGFCAGHVQQLLEKRDGPSRKKLLSVEDKIARAQEKVRQRAEKRIQEYDKNNLLLQEAVNNDFHDELTLHVPQLIRAQKSRNADTVIVKNNTTSSQEEIVQNVLKVPVHHDLALENSSEVEISHNTGPAVRTQAKNEVNNLNEDVTRKKTESINEAVLSNDTTKNNITTDIIAHVITDTKNMNTPESDVGIEKTNNLILNVKPDEENLTANELTIAEIKDEGETNENKVEANQQILHPLNGVNCTTLNSDENAPIFSEKKDEVASIIEEKNTTKCADENNASNNKDINGFHDSLTSNNDGDNVLTGAVPPFESASDIQVSNVTEFNNKFTGKATLEPINNENIEHTDSTTAIQQENYSSVTQDANTDIDNAETKNGDDAGMVTTENNELSDNGTNDAHTELKDQLIESTNRDVSESGQQLASPSTDVDKDFPTLITENSETEVNNVNDAKSANIDSLADITSPPQVDENNKVTLDSGEHDITRHDTQDNPTDSIVNSSNTPTHNIEAHNEAISIKETSDNMCENLPNDNRDPGNMDLETAAITIQKVFRNFLFKSRGSTFEDTGNGEGNFLDEDDKNKEECDFPIAGALNIDRRAHGITRMDTVLQTVNEEKSLSLSDDSSTLSSAATIIQAHVRGFLVRNRLNSYKTVSTNSLAASNSNDPSITSIEAENDQNKNKTVLNIHIVPEGNYLSRDESLITSMELSLDSSPPSSINLHPLGYDKSQRRKQLKREDAIQSISPPSNNSGKLSEDIDSVKELSLNEHDLVAEHLLGDNNYKKDALDYGNGNNIPIENISVETALDLYEADANNKKKMMDDSETHLQQKEKSAIKMNSDEMDVVTPYISSENSALLHSGEFHDAVLLTRVSRSDTSVVSEFKNVLVYFLLWNHS